MREFYKLLIGLWVILAIGLVSYAIGYSFWFMECGEKPWTCGYVSNGDLVGGGFAVLLFSTTVLLAAYYIGKNILGER